MEENKNITNAEEISQDQLETVAGGSYGGVNCYCPAYNCDGILSTRYSPSMIRVTCPKCGRKFIVQSGQIIREEK